METISHAVNGTVLAMESSEANGEIFHIGDDTKELRIEEFVKYIGEVCGYKGEYEIVEAVSGSVSRRCPDITKARKLLGYEPKVSWQDGVKGAVDWYVNYINEGKEVFE